MRKILFSIVIMTLLSVMSLSISAQLFKQGKIQKNKPEIATTKDQDLSYTKINAFSDGNGTLIKWETDFEVDNLGFNIYRIDGGNAFKVNLNLIAGGFLQSEKNSKEGRQYTFFDSQGNFNSVYRIENVNIKGTSNFSQTFYPKYANNLTDVSELSFDELQRSAAESNPVSVIENPILPKELKNLITANDSLSDINTQRWVASQPGVKIGIKSGEGFYRVTKAQLQAAGFDTNASPALWQLYLNGVEQAINVQANGDYVEFYGSGIDTLESDTNIYFLIVGSQNGKRIQNQFLRRIGGNVIGTNYDYSSEKKERTLYISSILNGSVENFFGSVISSTAPAIINFNLNAIDFSTGKANIEVTLQGLTFTSHQVVFKLNGQQIDTITGANKNSYSKIIGIPVGLLQNGANTIELQSTTSSDISVFTKLKVNYKRLYEADQNKLAFYTRNLNVTNLTGFTSSSVRVFDTTYPDTPVLITNAVAEPANKEQTLFSVSIPSHRTRKMYALTDSEVKQVFSVTQNFPSTLSNAANDGSLVIITNRSWLSEANTYAAYRQNDGFAVKVIDVEDVYDEFGFGVRSSNSIKDFLNYAKTNWQTPPNYVLVLGDTTYDPKNYSGFGFHSYVPIQLADTLYEETGSDEAMADFDNDGLSEIAIGRIPARNPQDVLNALGKVQLFEQTISTAPARGSLCASDLPNGYDFAGLCNRVQNELPASIPTMTINRASPTAKTDLINAMNTGKYIVNYSGHGSTGAWVNSTFFASTDVPSLTNANNLSMYTMLTCLNGYFIRPVDDSLSEVLLKATNGGAVAVWSSSGSTTPDVQEVMAKRFFNQLGNNPSMIRLGDLIRDAKANLVGGTDVRRSWGLLGDPTLKMK